MALSKNCTLQPGEVAAQYAEEICNNDIHGYSQPNRKGDGTTYKLTLTDGSTIDVDGGDIDCSELGLDCYRNQGIDVGDATYSRNMDELVYTGNFIDVGTNPSRWTRGDLLVVPGHVAIWLGNGMLAEAHHGDFAGGLSGWKGDQDGTEVRVRSYYDDGWTNVYHCIVHREVAKKGWKKEDGYWYYYDNNQKLTNKWLKDVNNGEWYYFGTDGRMITNDWVKDGGEWYYLGDDGIMYRNRWLKDEGEWYYLDSLGKMVRNMPLNYKGKWCWMDDLGRCVKDAKLIVDDEYYIVGVER